MSFILFLLLIIAAVLGFIYFQKLKAGHSDTDSAAVDHWPFMPKKPLSPPEQVLYYRLLDALPGFVVLPQVGLSRFLAVKKGENQLQWFNRINRMSVDFLLCNKAMQIIAAIELDDSTHDQPQRKKADTKKDAVLASAGIKLIRWHVKSVPTKEQIADQFLPKAIAAPSKEPALTVHDGPSFTALDQ